MPLNITMPTLWIALVLASTPAFCDQSITLLNEIDQQTGHDNHMVTVQLFGDRAEITYCDGTGIENLLPLIRTLQSDNRHPVVLRSVAFHEFDLHDRNWVIIGICNRIKDSDPSIIVYASRDIPKPFAMSLGATFKSMRDVPVVYRPRSELTTFFKAEKSE